MERVIDRFKDFVVFLKLEPETNDICRIIVKAMKNGLPVEDYKELPTDLLNDILETELEMAVDHFGVDIPWNLDQLSVQFFRHGEILRFKKLNAVERQIKNQDLKRYLKNQE